MTDVIIVYNEPKQIEEFENNQTLKFKFIDSKTTKGKKEAMRVKYHYAARLEPFAVILDNSKPIRAFYSEAEDVIKALSDYLKENGY